MSEAQESFIRSQALLMMYRNQGKLYIVKRILKRFLKCLRNG